MCEADVWIRFPLAATPEVVAGVGSGDDRAQRDQVALDQHPDVLVHLEAKLGERPPELGVIALQAGPATRPVEVVGEKSAVDPLIDARRLVGVDRIEEGAHELVCALRLGRRVETIKTRDRGGAHRRYPPCVADSCAGNRR
jgi:hypothetical protein